MTPAACTVAVLAVLLAGTSVVGAQSRDYKGQNLDLLRLLVDKPWIGLGPHNRWDRTPSIETDFGDGYEPQIHKHVPPQTLMDSEDDSSNYMDDDLRLNSNKRSAVATVINSGRRRRQPTPALGKTVTPYVGVGILSDVGTFFDYFRDNIETLASLSPQQRSDLFQDPPSVVNAPSSANAARFTSVPTKARHLEDIPSGGGGSGTGIRRLHALRPLRPTGNIRSYNRRSFVEADGVYPGANHHDPGLLWTGLGR